MAEHKQPLIPYDDALQIIRKVAERHLLPNEEVSALSACRRVVSEDVHASEQVPPFANSAMDGFVLLREDVVSASIESPVKLIVRGLVAAGDGGAFRAASAVSPQGQAFEIMTGAPIPMGGWNAVIRIEDVRVERNPNGEAVSIQVSRPVREAENIRPAGTDFEVGQLVLPERARLGPEHVLACASLGISRLKVKRNPRVGVVSTGSELVPPDAPTLEPGMIRNSTAAFLVAALEGLGIQAEFLGLIPDAPKDYRQVIEQALDSGIDIIISTGAVSVGKFDFVPEVLRDVSAEIHFHKAAIRPGKPVLFAEFNRAPRKAVFFGMPGNPVATAVGLRFFVEPYLRAVLGLQPEAPLKAMLSKECDKPKDLRCFFKGHIQSVSGALQVEALKAQASYVVSSMLQANCWLVLPEEGSKMETGAEVEAYPLRNGLDGGFFS